LPSCCTAFPEQARAFATAFFATGLLLTDFATTFPTFLATGLAVCFFNGDAAFLLGAAFLAGLATAFFVLATFFLVLQGLLTRQT